MQKVPGVLDDYQTVAIFEGVCELLANGGDLVSSVYDLHPSGKFVQTGHGRMLSEDHQVIPMDDDSPGFGTVLAHNRPNLVCLHPDQAFGKEAT